MPMFTSSTEITTASTSPANPKAVPVRFLSAPWNQSRAWKKWLKPAESKFTVPKDLLKLTSGPGRLAQAFAITRTRDNGAI